MSGAHRPGDGSRGRLVTRNGSRLPEILRASILTLLLLFAALAGPSARAQPALPSTAAEPAASAEAIDALIRQLEDPQARAELIARLRALRDAGGETPPPTTAESALDQLSRLVVERVDVALRVLAALGTLSDSLPLLGDWFSFQLTNDYRRELWRNVLTGVAQALGLGALVAWLTARLLRRQRARVPRSGRDRLRLAALDLVPASVFAGVSGLVLDLGGFLPATARVAWLAVAAIFADRVLSVAVRHVAEANGLALAGAPADSPAGALQAVRRIGGLVIYGYAALLVAGRLGLPPDLYDASASLFVLLVAAVFTVAILVRRGALEQLVRGLARWIEADFLRRLLLLDRLIGSSHLWLVALVWLNAGLLVLGIGWGPVRATLATVLVLLLAHLLLTWLDRPSGPPRPAAEGEEPGEPVAALETPLATRLLKIAVKLGALILLLEAWGVGLLPWLATPVGRESLRTVLRVGLILAVCFALWRFSSWWIGGFIKARDAQGNVLYSNRARTAAAIAKSVIVVVLLLIAVTSVLSELGIQATPLLAGAGVIGLAVGFGSQKLVQDIINGLFILLGDTIRVGDVVDLGGRSGVVEAISMRTVTLRSYNGDVHTIPFGTIDSITNMTRDYSFWVLDVGVSYKENVDRVIAVLHEIETKMRREWPWRRLILEPLEIAGLDRLADSAVVIRGRLKVRPGEQWRVGREFNRRMKRRFDELGIEFPFPQRTVHLVSEQTIGPVATPEAAVPAPPPSSAAAGGRG